MRLVCILSLALFATPAVAQQNDAFEGAYVGIEAGYANLSASVAGFSVSDDSAILGGTFGYRGAVGSNDRFILGVEGNLDFLTNGSDLGYGVAGIAGYKTSDLWLLYARVGYSRLDSDGNVNLDGLQYGGGIEYMLSDRYSVRLDYRRIAFEDFLGVDLHGNDVTFGLNFNF